MNVASGRPRVICHMAASVDGRLVVDGWPADAAAAVRRQYEQVHASYGADGWLCGRVTMAPFAQRLRSEAEVGRAYAGGAPRGRLAWASNAIDGDHVVAILSERVSDDYLGFLRAGEHVDIVRRVDGAEYQGGIPLRPARPRASHR